LDLLSRSVYSNDALLIKISDARGISELFTVDQIESVSEVVYSCLVLSGSVYIGTKYLANNPGE
jgi:hypothetical protein